MRPNRLSQFKSKLRIEREYLHIFVHITDVNSKKVSDVPIGYRLEKFLGFQVSCKDSQSIRLTKSVEKCVKNTYYIYRIGFLNIFDSL